MLDREGFQNFLSAFPAGVPIAIDTETSGLHWNSVLRMVQFGGPHGGFAVPWVENADYLVDIFRKMDANQASVVFHNAKFDLHRLELAGVDIEHMLATCHDTQLMAHSFNPAGGHGLKQLGKDILGLTNDPEVELKKYFRGVPRGRTYTHLREHETREGVQWGVKEARIAAAEAHAGTTRDWDTIELDNPYYVAYALSDVYPLTSGLWEYYDNMLSPKAKAVYDFERNVQKVLYRMESKGLLIDNLYTENLRTAWKGEAEELFGAIQSYGVQNPGSDAQVTEVLIEQGWKPTKFTATGKAQLNKDVLSDLIAEGYELASLKQQYERKVKWIGAYLDHFIEQQDDNGRVHASLNGARARTGRMSITDPALQTLPSHDPTIRDCVIPASGSTLISVDYSQIEMLIVASFAGEEGLLNAARSGNDLHTATAQALFDVEEVSYEQRSLAKIGNYGTVYGGGPKAISRQAGVPYLQAKKFRDLYFELYPKLKAYIDEATAEARRHGCVVLETGRVLPVDFGHEYAAVNYKVQGTASEVMKSAILRLDAEGLTEYMLVPVHDEILFEAPLDIATDVMYTAENAMSDHSFSLPIITDAEIAGDRWGNLYRD